MKSDEGKRGQQGSRRPRQASSSKRDRVVDLVTGGTSGIGIRLIQALLDRGDEVRVLVQEHPNTNPDWKRLPPKIIPYVADLKLQREGEYKMIKEACRGADNIFHLAAATARIKADFDEYINSNVIGTENLLKACVEANPDATDIHFIYISTTAVYGNSRKGEVITEESETSPSGPYGESKLMAEQVIKSFTDVHQGIKYTIARVATMYGPYYEWSFFKLFKGLVERKMPYIGNGQNHITLIHIDDVVDCFLAFTEKPQSANKIFNLTDGRSYTLKGLLDKAAEFLNVPPPARAMHPAILKLGAKMFGLNKEEVDFLTSDRVVSIDKLKEALNFIPSRSIDEDGKQMADDFLERQK